MLPTCRNSGTAVWAPAMLTALEGAVWLFTEGLSECAAPARCPADLPDCQKADEGFMVPSEALECQGSRSWEPRNGSSRANHAMTGLRIT